MRIAPIGIATLGLLLAHSGPAAAEKPAVSEPNGLASASFAAGGSAGENAEALLVGGQYSVPVGENFGARMSAQIGAAFGNGTSGAEAVTGRAEGFWRRPETGFIEVGGFGTHLGSVDLYGAHLTGGRYVEDWDYELGLVYLDTSEGSALAARGELGRYVSDDFRVGFGLSAGSSFKPSASYSGSLNALWQPSTLENIVFSFVASGGVVDDQGFYQAGLSAVYYFGESRSLQQKIREDW